MPVRKDFPVILHRCTNECYAVVPSTAEARGFTDSVVSLLFPQRSGERPSIRSMELKWEQLQEVFYRMIVPLCTNGRCDCRTMSDEFFASIPDIYFSLLDDARMYDDCDPASYCREEIILCYPGFYAVMVYRLSNLMYRIGIPILPRVISEYAHSQTGIDINPGATIGPGFYIDHGTGVVIGETTIIGRNVRIYQGVTLGAKYVEKAQQGHKRHPEIGDDVIIYAGSTILGGNTVVGHNSVIGGNVWLTHSVEPYSKVYHNPEITIHETARD